MSSSPVIDIGIWAAAQKPFVLLGARRGRALDFRACEKANRCREPIDVCFSGAEESE